MTAQDSDADALWDEYEAAIKALTEAASRYTKDSGYLDLQALLNAAKRFAKARAAAREES